MAIFYDRGFAFNIPDEWWFEGGMIGFTPTGQAYAAGEPEPNLGLENRPVLTIPIDEIEAPRRALSHGVFNDGAVTARERVVRILMGFRQGTPLPPVQVCRSSSPGQYHHLYRLYHGAHRFYCSVAAGYSHISAIEIESQLN